MADNWILWTTAAIASVGTLAVLGPSALRAARNRPPKPKRASSAPSPVAELVCPACEVPCALFDDDFRKLVGPELALVVSQRPAASGRPLSLSECPHCNASLTFLADSKPLELLGANIFAAHNSTTVCAQCREAIRAPDWDTNEKSRHRDARDLLGPRHGLECERCGAVCCVQCSEDMSRNRTTDGSLICPRCYRKPLEKIYCP